MKAVTWAGPDRLEIVDIPAPVGGPGWVLLEVSRVGICGSDLAIFKGFHARAQPGIVLGHEFGGTVVDAGPDGAVPVGTRVAVRPLISCADRGADLCPACTQGFGHVCASLGLYGVDEPGGLAEYVAVRTSSVYPMAAGVSEEFAALAEPLAVAVHAVDRSGLRAGDRVVVFGAGPIGLLTALVARHCGAADVVIVEPNSWRRGVAAGYGLHAVASDEDPVGTIRARTGGAGADVVFDSAAHPSVAAQLTEVARIRGTVVVVGVYKQPTPIDLRTVNFAEHTIIGTRVYTADDFATAVELLNTDTLGLEALPTTTFAMGESYAAFESAGKGDTSIKVFFDPTRDKDL